MELRILRQLQSQHRDLMRRRRSVELELSALVALAEKGEETERVLLRATSLLTALRRDLAEHLGLEERAGLLSAAAEAAPRLSRRARRLTRDHAQLESELARLLDDLLASQSAPERWVDLAQGFGRFSEKLLAHEQAEDEVVHQAFMEDLGGG